MTVARRLGEPGAGVGVRRGAGVLKKNQKAWLRNEQGRLQWTPRGAVGEGGVRGGGGAIETIAGLNLNFVHYVTFSHNHNCSNGLLRLQSLVLSRFLGRSRTTE